MGGMAEIFRGVATAGGGFEKPVAIKRILPHLSQDQRFIELLIAEAKILSELHHRNIVQIYDVGLGDDGQYFLVMEFVDGTDLKRVYEHLFDGRKLPIEVALHICSEVCEALEHAHIAKDAAGKSLGLVHRDVSPSNVLLSKSGEVKLTDFGIAKRHEEVTGHGAVRGKFAYISPEQAVNQHVDARSDVYSVGILLYELVCGQRLFSGLADFDALRAVREGRVRPSALHVPGVAPEIAQIIMKALSKDPEHRYATAGAFGAALRGYRYSLETNIADPAAEIAALVVREGRSPSRDSRGDSDSDFENSGTVVRIDTAAEFNLTDLSGLHQLVTSFPQPRIRDTDAGLDDDPLDDEKTIARANPLLNPVRNAHPKSSDHVEDLGATIKDTRERVLPGVGPADDGDFQMATIPRTARPEALVPPAGPKPRSPKSLFPAAALPRPKRAKAAAARAAAADVPLAPALPAGPRPNLERAATPTERDVFHAHAMLPAAGARPIYGGAGLTAAEAEQRRKKIKIGLIAGSLAVAAFMVAGHFFGGEDRASANSSELDGGSRDAGLVIPPPIDASTDADGGAKEPPPKQKKKKKVRKRGKKKGKTNKGRR